MLNPDSPDLPKEWQKQPHYSWRIEWLTTNPSQEQLQEINHTRQIMLGGGGSAELLEDSYVNPKGFLGFEGWFLHFTITGVLVGSSAPLAEIKNFLTNSDFRDRWMLSRHRGQPAPTHVYKQQRKALFALIEAEFQKNIGADNRSKVLLPIDETYALCVSIDNALFTPRFKAEFSSPINPIRSFVGQEFRVSKYDLDEEDWVQAAQGILEINENTVKVGEWTQTFDPKEIVHGSAFEDAWIEPEDLGLFGFHKPDQMPPDAGFDDDVD
jgi:hypothetical protein